MIFAALALVALEPIEPVKLGLAEARVVIGQTQPASDGSRVLPMSRSSDGGLDAGVYAANGSTVLIEAYTTDEFMLILLGKIVLTSASGKVTRLRPGDTVFIPKGWKGTWDATDYRKFYVVPQTR